MASIFREIRLGAAPEAVWAAVREVGAVDRLAPGFVTACTLEGSVRTVTFANGATVKEAIVDLDDRGRRLAYTTLGGRASHYAASLLVSPTAGGSTLAWRIDLLPDELAPAIAGMVELGVSAITRRFEAPPRQV